MAIPATTVLEVQTGGNDLNAGAFDSAASGIDRSQGTSPHVTIDGVTITAVVHTSTDQLTITGHTVDDGDDSGNYVRISGGTATAGLYKILSADEPNNRWVLDRSAGTAAQTATGRMGGCLASPGRAAADATVSGNKIWVKTGTYTITTTTPGTAGPVLFASNVTVTMEGYSATRGDRAATPTLSAGAQTGVSLFAGQGSGGTRLQRFISMKADGNSQSSIIGFNAAASADVFRLCVAANCTSSGFSGATQNAGFILCYADACAIGFDRCNAVFCVAKSCTTTGFVTSGGRLPRCCIAYQCADGYAPTGGNNTLIVANCIADACTSNGFNFGTGAGAAYNCIASNQSGGGDTGFTTSGTSVVSLVNCAIYNNGTGFSGTFAENSGSITLTADPYVNQPSADFRANFVTGGGALLRATGIGVYGQTNSIDVGAVQNSAPIHIVKRPSARILNQSIHIRRKTIINHTTIINRPTIISRPRRVM